MNESEKDCVVKKVVW